MWNTELDKKAIAREQKITRTLERRSNDLPPISNGNSQTPMEKQSTLSITKLR